MLAEHKASAKNAADRIAVANRKCQKGWRNLFAQVVSCEILRNKFTLLEGVECDELREEARSKNSFVSFMQNENSDFVSYYIFREYTVLFDKMKERRPNEFMLLNEDGLEPEKFVKHLVNILIKLKFNGVTETNKLLRTPEEEEAAEADAIARREANAYKKRVKRDMASKQLAMIAQETDGPEPEPEPEHDPDPEPEPEPREDDDGPHEDDDGPHEDAAEETIPPKKKRGRPRKPQKQVVSILGDEQDDIIGQLLANADPDPETDVDTDEEGVEEAKGCDDANVIKKCGRPKKPPNEMVVVPPEGQDDTVQHNLANENAILRTRVEQLEQFIIGIGKELPPMITSEDDEANNTEEKEEEEVGVKIFTHDGVKYYKDTTNNLYEFGCDMDDPVLVGTWNDLTKCIEEVDTEDEDDSENEDDE